MEIMPSNAIALQSRVAWVGELSVENTKVCGQTRRLNAASSASTFGFSLSRSERKPRCHAR